MFFDTWGTSSFLISTHYPCHPNCRLISLLPSSPWLQATCVSCLQSLFLQSHNFNCRICVGDTCLYIPSTISYLTWRSTFPNAYQSSPLRWIASTEDSTCPNQIKFPPLVYSSSCFLFTSEWHNMHHLPWARDPGPIHPWLISFLHPLDSVLRPQGMQRLTRVIQDSSWIFKIENPVRFCWKKKSNQSYFKIEMNKYVKDYRP